MKKILTASLVAIMAVTAANADIASTKYVDDQTGVSADGTFGFEGVISDQTTLAGAVKKIAGELGTGGSVTTQITTALKDATADDFSDSVKTSLGLADTAVQTTTFNTFKGENTTAIATAKQEAIDAAKSAGDIAYAGKSLETTVSNMDAAYKAADTAINDKIGAVTEGKTVVEMIEAAQTAATYNDTEVRGLISGNAGEISTIKGEQTTQNNKISALETSLTAEGDTGKAIAAAQKAGEDAQAAADKAQGDIDAYKTSNDTALAGVKATADAAAVKSAVDASIQDLQGQIDAVEAGTALAAKAVTTDKIADAAVTETQLNATVNASLDKADSAVQSVTAGATNGTINVDGTEVTVTGLGSAAYTEASAYATAAQGLLADSAVQKVEAGAANGEISVDGNAVKVTGLTDVAFMAKPESCENGAATCALVFDKDAPNGLRWEAIIK